MFEELGLPESDDTLCLFRLVIIVKQWGSTGDVMPPSNKVKEDKTLSSRQKN